MSTTEDRARAAMRAVAATVDDAPPLRVAQAQELASSQGAERFSGDDPHRSGRTRFGGFRSGERSVGLRRPGGAGLAPGRGRRHWSVLAPIAAAVTVVAVAVALVVIRNVSGGPVAASPPASSASASAATASGNPPGANEVPEYYVAWMQADRPYLVVGNTFTGKTIATVMSPANDAFQAVYGAADDRTFIVTGDRLRGAYAGPDWYLLRIAPGSKTPARLTQVPIPVRENPAGVALSPDGTEVAVALPGSPAKLGIYSVATGKLLRQWSTTAPGELTAEKVPPGSWQFTAMTLRWSIDGRQLAFAWNASAIRVLNANGPGGNLMTSSTLAAAIGTTYATLGSFTCKAAQGWQLITVAKGPAAGQGVVCAGSALAERYTPCTSPTDTKCKYTQQTSIGFLRATTNAQGASYLGLDGGADCVSQGQSLNGAYLGWANADSSALIGSLVCAGHARFGIFHGSKFTPLPALPVSLPLPTGVMEGTVAW